MKRLSIYHVNARIDDGRRGLYGACATGKRDAAASVRARVLFDEEYDACAIENIERVSPNNTGWDHGQVICYTLEDGDE